MSQSQLQWQERYAIGIPAVDHEHQELIRMINDLVMRILEGTDVAFVSDSLGDILSAIGAHFALEEKIMRDRHYDQYFDHKSDHDRLLDQLRDLPQAAALGRLLAPLKPGADGRTAADMLEQNLATVVRPRTALRREQDLKRELTEDRDPHGMESLMGIYRQAQLLHNPQGEAIVKEGRA